MARHCTQLPVSITLLDLFAFPGEDGSSYPLQRQSCIIDLDSNHWVTILLEPKGTFCSSLSYLRLFGFESLSGLDLYFLLCKVGTVSFIGSLNRTVVTAPKPHVWVCTCVCLYVCVFVVVTTMKKEAMNLKKSNEIYRSFWSGKNKRKII